MNVFCDLGSRIQQVNFLIPSRLKHGLPKWHRKALTFSSLILCVLANSEDPDEMTHCAAFHQGLHCLLG